MAQIDRHQYWRIQLRRTVGLLAVWFTAGYAMSILFIERLNEVQIGGIPFGFWMAQQGSIYVFVLLILVFAVLTGRLDRQAGLNEEDRAKAPQAPH
jgi:putative solute:sodium symporter small subunit